MPDNWRELLGLCEVLEPKALPAAVKCTQQQQHRKASASVCVNEDVQGASVTRRYTHLLCGAESLAISFGTKYLNQAPQVKKLS